MPTCIEMHSRSWWTLHWEGTVTDKDSQFVAWNWQMNFRLFSVLLCVNIADCKVFENPKKGFCFRNKA